LCRLVHHRVLAPPQFLEHAGWTIPHYMYPNHPYARICEEMSVSRIWSCDCVCCR